MQVRDEDRVMVKNSHLKPFQMRVLNQTGNGEQRLLGGSFGEGFFDLCFQDFGIEGF